MIKAIWLVVNPASAWEAIALSRRHVLSILFLYVIPMVALSCAAEGYGLAKWGRMRGEVPHLVAFTKGHALLFEVLQGLCLLLTVLICAKLVEAIGETFHGRHTFTEGLTAVGYGMGPFFVIKCFDAFTTFSPWLTWLVGLALTASVLYHGIPRVMRPDPPHAFGLYLMSVLLLVLITGLLRFLTAWYLGGKFLALERSLSGLGARLHF